MPLNSPFPWSAEWVLIGFISKPLANKGIKLDGPKGGENRGLGRLVQPWSSKTWAGLWISQLPGLGVLEITVLVWEQMFESMWDLASNAVSWAPWIRCLWLRSQQRGILWIDMSQPNQKSHLLCMAQKQCPDAAEQLGDWAATPMCEGWIHNGPASGNHTESREKIAIQWPRTGPPHFSRKM